MARLASHVWVGAYLARLGAEGIPAHLVHKGDEMAGAVAVKLATLDGKATLFTRIYDSQGQRAWEAQLADQPEGEIDEAIRRQRGYDPDLWVVEVEDPRGRHLLDQMGLME
ncbi:MAG: DUF1491 family protein [Pseudomonadota bacterium]